MRPNILLGVFLSAAFVMTPAAAYVTEMYFTSVDAVRRTSDFSYAPPEFITFSTSSAAGLAIDAAGGKIYWTEFGTTKIVRANLDGSNAVDIVTGLSGPEGIAIDVAGGKIYWTDDIGSIQRANLDGTNVQSIVTSLPNPGGLALDLVNGKVYWTDTVSDTIERADLDGSNAETIVPVTLGVTSAIAVDGTRGNVFWHDTGDNQVYKANLDGTGAVSIGDSGPPLESFSLDEGRNILFATSPGNGRVDGYPVDTAVEFVALIPPDTPKAVVYDSVTASLYVSESLTSAIRRYPYAETDSLVPLTIGTGDIEIDQVNGKMYWAEWDFVNLGSSVSRADLDGSNIEAMFPSEIAVIAVALDRTAGKLYWTDLDANQIYRSDLDGSNRETLPVAGFISGPAGIEVDTQNGHIYWCNYNSGVISRADLDGQNATTAVMGLVQPFGIALDVPAGKIYWNDRGAELLQRSDFDGDNLQTLGPAAMWCGDIELDLADQKLYWTQFAPDVAVELRRANLDGTSPELLGIAGLWPSGLALVLESIGGPAGTITSNIPPNQIHEGDHLILTAPAGTGYQWRKDNVTVSGETSGSMSFNPVTMGNAGTYSVIYDNGLKSAVESFPFALNVLPALPVPVATPAGLIALAAAVVGMTLRRSRRANSSRNSNRK